VCPLPAHYGLSNLNKGKSPVCGSLLLVPASKEIPAKPTVKERETQWNDLKILLSQRVKYRIRQD